MNFSTWFEAQQGRRNPHRFAPWQSMDTMPRDRHEREHTQLGIKLNQALAATWGVLTQRANDSDFAAMLRQCFGPLSGGEQAFGKRCATVMERLQSGDHLDLRFEVVSADRLQGAFAAFAASGPNRQPMILINGDWLKQATGAELQAVLLEIGRAHV